jgi:hypothetical protein
MAQRERGLQCGWGAEEEGVAGDGAAEVIENHRQPRPRGAARLIEDEQVELRVVGLPDRVGRGGLAPQRQLEAVAVGGRTVMSEREQTAVERGDDRPSGRVTRCRPAAFGRQPADLPVHVRDRRSRAPQREALDQRNDLRRHAPRAAVGARGARQAREPAGAKASQRRAVRSGTPASRAVRQSATPSSRCGRRTA